MTHKQEVLLKYPQATLFKSGNDLYMILDRCPMGLRIENERNETPSAAWKAAAFLITVNSIRRKKAK